MRCDLLQSPAGPVRVTTHDGVLVRVELGARGRADPTRPTPVAREAVRQLREYFAGRRNRFTLPWRLDLTEFQRAVLGRVADIPWGTALSYGEVAAEIGHPRAARAVGQALGANPLAIVIPCHRVLAGDGGLGGFGAGLRWKRALLALEGIGTPAPGRKRAAARPRG